MTDSLQFTISHSISSIFLAERVQAKSETVSHQTSRTAQNGIQQFRELVTRTASDYYKKLELTASSQSRVTSIVVRTFVPTFEVPTERVVSDIASVFSSLVELSGLSETEASEKLLGFSRQAASAWKRTGKARPSTLERMLATRAILFQAQASMRRQGFDDRVSHWLKTPRGESGTTPLDLFHSNQLSRARLLAITTIPAQREHRKSWMAGESLDPETVRIGRILGSTSEEDYLPARLESDCRE